MHKGLTVHVVAPAAPKGESLRYAVTPSVSTALTAVPNAPAGYYVAASDGVVTVTVSAAPACPAGSACPMHVTAVGSITLTVWG